MMNMGDDNLKSVPRKDNHPSFIAVSFHFTKEGVNGTNNEIPNDFLIVNGRYMYSKEPEII